jgi:predicted transcriptional regulator
MLHKFKLRTMEELWKKLGTLCDIFSPDECQNYFKNEGYGRIIRLQNNA